MPTFDPYHQWLGIPAAEQPPNHYRLLGVPLLESDLDKIEASANASLSGHRRYRRFARTIVCGDLVNVLKDSAHPEEPKIRCWKTSS